MVKYKCFRCGYECNQKGMLLKHLSRKFQCESKLQEIDNIDILKLNKIDEYNKNRYKVIIKSSLSQQKVNIQSTKSKHSVNKKLTSFICEFCNKEFTYKQSHWRHKKTCKIKKELDNKNSNLQNQLDDMKEIMKKQAKEIDKLKKMNDKKDKVINNITNNTTNNNYYLNFHNFGSQAVGYLESNYMDNFLKNPMKNFERYLKDIFFNKEYPANQNIRLHDIKSGKGKMYLNNEWNELPLKVWTEKILKDSLTQALNFVDTDNDDLLKYEEILKTTANDDSEYESEDDDNGKWFIGDNEKKDTKYKKNKLLLEKIVKLKAEKLTKKLEAEYKKFIQTVVDL